MATVAVAMATGAAGPESIPGRFPASPGAPRWIDFPGFPPPEAKHSALRAFTTAARSGFCFGADSGNLKFHGVEMP